MLVISIIIKKQKSYTKVAILSTIKLTISYDGSLYNGSQIQPDVETIHSKLDDAFKLININTHFNFSGRTDKGVHAFKQVISCQIPDFWTNLRKLKETLNRLLPNSILVRSIHSANDDFHARFSAKQRNYRYLLTNKKLSPFNANYQAFYPIIDENKINETIKELVGIHDFEFFSKKGSDPVSTIREIYDIKFYEYKGIYVLNFRANSYLRSQIRMMVDFIMKISAGKLTIEELKQQLKKEKLVSWTLAPPTGLYLSKIYY